MHNLRPSDHEVNSENKFSSPPRRGTTPSRRLLSYLREAGPEGCTPRALALALYGQTSYAELGKVSVLIGNLRRKGNIIHTLVSFDGTSRSSKYVLGAYRNRFENGAGRAF